MRYATLFFCALLSCGVGTSLESVEEPKPASPRNLAIRATLHARNSMSCNICARPCLDEEQQCLHDISNLCRDGLVCIERATSCVKEACGDHCLYKVPFPNCDDYQGEILNLYSRNCIGPRANPCLCNLDLCLNECHLSGSDHACVEQCDSEYDNCTAGL